MKRVVLIGQPRNGLPLWTPKNAMHLATFYYMINMVPVWHLMLTACAYGSSLSLLSLAHQGPLDSSY